jgi:hypothetical protein
MLVLDQHVVRRAGRDSAPILNMARTVFPQRVQQGNCFVGGSVPDDSSCHGGADLH